MQLFIPCTKQYRRTTDVYVHLVSLVIAGARARGRWKFNSYTDEKKKKTNQLIPDFSYFDPLSLSLYYHASCVDT